LETPVQAERKTKNGTVKQRATGLQSTTKKNERKRERREASEMEKPKRREAENIGKLC
jgi:hypothetical protein